MQTARQTEMETENRHIRIDRQTDIQTTRHTDIYTDIQTIRHADRQTC